MYILIFSIENSFHRAIIEGHRQVVMSNFNEDYFYRTNNDGDTDGDSDYTIRLTNSCLLFVNCDHDDFGYTLPLHGKYTNGTIGK